MSKYDLFIFAAEDSADVHGSNLIKELLKVNPKLKILATPGPRMRKFKLTSILKMEDFHVMGFIDVLLALPRLIKNFFFLKKAVLKNNPKACVFIDYPDFNLRLEKSLRKNGYKNKLIHYISPTVWAWRKKRAAFMAKYLDLLLTIFPFEKQYFSNLKVEYIGHPLAYEIKSLTAFPHKKELIGIFPGSRKKEIERNFPVQLLAIKKLLQKNKTLKFAISLSHKNLIYKIFKKYNFDKKNFVFFKPSQNYETMQKMSFALATSGTINLELALNKVPTIVNFVIRPLDLFIARNLLKINLPFYCIVNIILNKEIFPELYGPNLSVEKLYDQSKKILESEEIKNEIISNCEKLAKILSSSSPNKQAAKNILNLLKN